MTEDRKPPWPISEINALDREAFVARLGFLFEGSPWIAAEAWAARPFRDRAALHRALCDAIARAGDARQVALIRAHPDLVGRAALARTLGGASAGEQAAAGLEPDRLTPREIARFEELNAAYRRRFGFPFVICAREHKQASILAGFETRLRHDRKREIAVAIGEIGKIGYYRLLDVVVDDAAEGADGGRPA